MNITIEMIKEYTLYGKVYRQGKQEGKEKTALNMLKKGMDVVLISEITGLPAERVVQLKQQLEADQ